MKIFVKIRWFFHLYREAGMNRSGNTGIARLLSIFEKTFFYVVTGRTKYFFNQLVFVTQKRRKYNE